jgi:hypothetical protein
MTRSRWSSASKEKKYLIRMTPATPRGNRWDILRAFFVDSKIRQAATGREDVADGD